MAVKAWHEARLIPTSGISGGLEQERRATSALLAVVRAVQEFGRAILKPCGAPAGKIEAYVEVPFELGKKQVRPDGLLRVSRGKREWTALVEVKTADNGLDKEQIENYLDVARQNGYDAVITISNEIPPVTGAHPLAIDRRKTKNVDLFHFSWVRLISMALMEKEVRGVEDPDQSWILGELIRYLEHEKSGALDFRDMGPSWVSVREDARKGVLRRTAPEVTEVATKFDALIRFACLRLGQRLGAEVFPQLSRKHVRNPEERTADLVSELDTDSCLAAKIRIPGTVADLDVMCDLRGQQIHTSVTVPASGHARNVTRVRWLLRQLSEGTQNLTLEALVRGRGRQAASVDEVREDESIILPDGASEVRRFRLSQIHPMGVARSARSKGSFITSVVESIDGFYADVLQRLKPWTPPAPKYRPEPQERNEDADYSSTDLSSMDAAEPAGPVVDEESRGVVGG